MSRNRIVWCFAAACLALAAGCESRNFKAERQMWRAHKLAEAIYKNPSGTPSWQLVDAQEAYRNIIKQYGDTLFAVQAQFSIGHLSLVKEEFQKAREAYGALTQDCKEKGNLCAEAHFAIGRTYELEGRWDDAAARFRKIMKDYPFSAKSLDLPLYIIRHYQKVRDTGAVQRSTDEAVSYYLDLKSRPEAQEGGGYVLQNLIIRAYMEAGQWPEALAGLDKLLRDYPNLKPQEALWIKSWIYASRLNDKLKAKEELQKIIADYPLSSVAKTAKELLKKL